MSGDPQAGLSAWRGRLWGSFGFLLLLLGGYVLGVETYAVQRGGLTWQSAALIDLGACAVMFGAILLNGWVRRPGPRSRLPELEAELRRP
jgi:hypothetical protein